ncbi:hypothetical protein OCOL_000412 [Ordospora colligata]|uniref:Uncharacterized protein n=1 Tax=Ordospora colligata OC4 TaxID=1354746 RepID=A0A0B2UJ57_9MICR|nr:uncharacterized protein M896_100040 [Ordospora colligata OC4]KHN69020.1 hypothetical protein M896_100040 [Ordospora colligata OC4]TBU14366.1 hypothetical protein CWI41_100050 [Ordospora colligata]
MPLESHVKRSEMQLTEEEIQSEKMNELKKANMRLQGEISILRKNMISLEKENFSMKEQKSQASLYELRKIESLKKEVNVLRVESRIKENQFRAFKKQKVEPVIDIKWALLKAKSEISFSLYPFEYRRLKFLKDFFYHDFCQLDSKLVIKEMKQWISRFKEFVEFYILFSCKAEVFKEFFHTVLVNQMFSERKIEFFNTLPVDWILNFNDERMVVLVKDYVDKNFRQMIFFLHRVVEERPFLLNVIMTKEMFNEVAKMNTKGARRLVAGICKRGGMSFVNHTNLQYVAQDDLKAIYGSQYFEVKLGFEL